PTNHLDLAGIDWLEKLIENPGFACVVVSHDRYFLENVTTEVAELNAVYPDGLFRVEGNYSAFLEKKAEYLTAQAKGRMRWKIASAPRWNGCGEARKHEQRKRRRGSIKRTR